MENLNSFFSVRVELFTGRWPAPLKRDLRVSLGLATHRNGRSPRLHSRRYDQPYWILLPFWLAERYRGRARLLDGAFLRESLWAQYCLFVFIRLRDDLFDGHTDRQSLMYASDLFLLEAERVFSKYFPKNSSFWSIYRNCIETTLFSILVGDRMERKPVKDREQLLDAHGATATICDVAPSAVCHRAGVPRMVCRVSEFSAEMMKAGAILDDLEDLEEDLGRARFNYASAFFLRGLKTGTARPQEIRRLIGGNFLTGDGLSRIFAEVHRHLDRAEEAMKPFAVPAAYGYVRRYRKLVVAAQKRLHQSRVQTVFG